ncbi:hypothetical protein B0H11DRAFT_2248585 [Mycena galericulata]|nr:hypothetical protein B0H11DRAFT_2248585 [Mycena galericulata]
MILAVNINGATCLTVLLAVPGRYSHTHLTAVGHTRPTGMYTPQLFSLSILTASPSFSPVPTSTADLAVYSNSELISPLFSHPSHRCWSYSSHRFSPVPTLTADLAVYSNSELISPVFLLAAVLTPISPLFVILVPPRNHLTVLLAAVLTPTSPLFVILVPTSTADLAVHSNSKIISLSFSPLFSHPSHRCWSYSSHRFVPVPTSTADLAVYSNSELISPSFSPLFSHPSHRCLSYSSHRFSLVSTSRADLAVHSNSEIISLSFSPLFSHPPRRCLSYSSHRFVPVPTSTADLAVYSNSELISPSFSPLFSHPPRRCLSYSSHRFVPVPTSTADLAVHSNSEIISLSFSPVPVLTPTSPLFVILVPTSTADLAVHSNSKIISLSFSPVFVLTPISPPPKEINLFQEHDVDSAGEPEPVNIPQPNPSPSHVNAQRSNIFQVRCHLWRQQLTNFFGTSTFTNKMAEKSALTDAVNALRNMRKLGDRTLASPTWQLAFKESGLFKIIEEIIDPDRREEIHQPHVQESYATWNWRSFLGEIHFKSTPTEHIKLSPHPANGKHHLKIEELLRAMIPTHILCHFSRELDIGVASFHSTCFAFNEFAMASSYR